MDTLVVKRVESLGESAEVTLASDRGEIVAFCHPCNLVAGQRVPNRLHGACESVKAAFLTDWPEEAKLLRAAERLESVGSFTYRGCGKVRDQSGGLVEVLGFIVDVGEALPFDGPLEFESMRISIWA